MRVYRVGGAKVCLLAEGVRSRPVNAYVAISEYVDEVLMNDQLISASCLGEYLFHLVRYSLG
ncbi:MAG: hypothetical protein B6U73_03100 [Desulfurococcales archaeon ex4484_204]|nr:MAG: hypothetical protein B6U73_03100 [Desulfurococcales archaeon ex4484_204]